MDPFEQAEAWYKEEIGRLLRESPVKPDMSQPEMQAFVIRNLLTRHLDELVGNPILVGVSARILFDDGISERVIVKTFQGFLAEFWPLATGQPMPVIKILKRGER
jgi:hypothetical protein